MPVLGSRNIPKPERVSITSTVCMVKFPPGSKRTEAIPNYVAGRQARRGQGSHTIHMHNVGIGKATAGATWNVDSGDGVSAAYV